MTSATKNMVRWVGLALLLAAAMSASAWAGNLYDGTGDPSTAGYVYFGSTTQAYGFTLDSQGGPTGSSPGYLLQNGAADEDGGFRFNDPGDLEFNRAAGWTVETRLKLNTTSTAAGATGAGFGMFFVIADDVRDWLFSINPSRITAYYGTAPGNPDTYADQFEYHGGATDGGGADVDMRQYHTLKFVQPAGGANGSLQVFYDGTLTDLDTGNAFAGFGRVTSLEFQDDGGGDAAGVYDYIAINTAAPALPLAEIDVHTPVSATVIQGGTGNLGFSLINSAGVGSQNLTTTAISPEALTGASYSAIGNVLNLPPGSNAGNLPFTATTSGTTPAGAHVLNPTVTGNASNSPFTASDADSPTLTVLDHSNGSFSDAADENTLMIDFGSLVQGSGSQPGGYEAIGFDVFNLVNTLGFTAALELHLANVSATGDSGQLFIFDGDTNFEFFGVPAGDSEFAGAIFDTNAPLGVYSATWTFGVEDHNAFNGHVANTIPLTLTLKGEIVPEPSTIVLLGLGIVGLAAGVARARFFPGCVFARGQRRRLILSNILVSGLALLLTAAMSASAWAGNLYNGTGDPSTAGYIYSGASSRDYVFTFDNETGGVPGMLLQNGNADEDGHYKYTSASEFNRATGWTAETRLKLDTTLTGNGNGFGAYLVFGDNVRDWELSINPLFISVYPTTSATGNPAGWPAANRYSVDMRDFHVLSFVQPAGGGDGSLQIYVDGTLSTLTTSDANTVAGWGGATSFSVNDNGGMDQRVLYDYIAINTVVPEPGSLALAALALTGIVWIARRPSQRARRS